jgi:hypothetical protein
MIIVFIKTNRNDSSVLKYYITISGSHRKQDNRARNLPVKPSHTRYNAAEKVETVCLVIWESTVKVEGWHTKICLNNLTTENDSITVFYIGAVYSGKQHCNLHWSKTTNRCGVWLE